MGSATTAPTGPFHHERVRASHQASGVPTSSRISVVLVRARSYPGCASNSRNHLATKASLLAWVTEASGRLRHSQAASLTSSQCSGR
jgi:hypothetical protein